MKVKALVNFSGIITMQKGEEKEIKNKKVRNSLIKAKYVEEIKSEEKGES